jgi:hypothetical protein
VIEVHHDTAETSRPREGGITCRMGFIVTAPALNRHVKWKPTTQLPDHRPKPKPKKGLPQTNYMPLE